MNNNISGEEVLKNRIEYFLNQGEGINVEFKECRTGLSKNVFETVCAFLNRTGGDLLLGVKDNGVVTGIDPSRIDQIKTDFANSVNNPQKLNPPEYLNINRIQFDDKTILHVSVPSSSQVHRCKNRIYDRNEDGDYDITHNNTQVAQLYLRKQNYYTENKIYPFVKISDLRSDVIKKVKALVTTSPPHPWALMTDEEFLSSAQLLRQDYETGNKGISLAGILLFGDDDCILSVLPHYHTDAILRVYNTDRYDDRDDIRTNLIDSYLRLMTFGEKHLSDPFFLEGTRRLSLRNIILREIVGNLLIHREYSSSFPAKFIIEKERLFTENASKSAISGPIDPMRFSPNPKNPVIARVFKEIGWADELGSGVRNLHKYCKFYGGFDPVLYDGNTFEFTLPLSNDIKSLKTSETKLVDGLVDGLVESQKKILELINENSKISKREMAENIGISTTAIDKNIVSLMKKGLLERIGSARSGYWHIKN